MKRTEPARLTASERLTEIVGLLALGYLRLVVREHGDLDHLESERDQLATSRRDEAPCDSRVLNPQSREPAA